MARLPFPLWTEYSYKMRWDCERCKKQMDIARLGCISAMDSRQF